MKETLKNLKKVYKYGKKYKINLICEIIGAIIATVIGILVPLLAAKQIVYLTNNIWTQVIVTSLVILFVTVWEKANSVFLRKNTQVFRRETVKNIQLELGKEILKINQADLDKNSSGMFIQRIVTDTDQMAKMFTEGLGYIAEI